MIKCDMGEVSIRGKKIVIKAELSTLIYALLKDCLSEDEIRECVENGINTTEKELDDFGDKLISDLLDMVLKGLKENEED